MALNPSAYFAAPTASSGWSSGNHTAADEWPPATGGSPDTCYGQHSSLGSGQAWLGGFDLSTAEGLSTKSVRLVVACYANTSTGYTVLPRLFDGISGTELWAASAPTTVNWEVAVNRQNILIWDIPDAAFAGNPDMDTLAVRFDMANLNAGNNRFYVNAARLSCNPIAASLPTPPTLAGKVIAAYRAADLITLGAEDGNPILVWPDATGQGQHLLHWTGTALWSASDAAAAFTTDRLTMRLRERWTGDFALVARFATDTLSGVQMVLSFAHEWHGINNVSDKNIMVCPDTDRAAGSVTMMSGDGSDGAHLNSGGGVLTAGVPTWITEYIRDADTDRVWKDAAAVGSPIISGNSGNNNLYSLSVAGRENDDRYWNGLLWEIWAVDMTGLDADDLTAARDWWVNGPGEDPAEGSGTITAIATTAGVGARPSTGHGTVTALATAAGTGARESRGAGTITTEAKAAAAGDRPSTGVGTVTAIATASGVGQADDIAQGSGTVTAIADTSGTGARQSQGAGTLTATAATAGVGTRTSHGHGTITAIASTTGVGETEDTREGHGTVTAIADTSGTGARQSQGAGTVTAIADTAGDGTRTSHGHGTITAVASTTGVGDTEDTRQGHGTITAIATAGGVGARRSAGDGTITAIATGVGPGARRSLGAGELAAVPALSGAGHRTSRGHGTVTAIASLIGTSWDVESVPLRRVVGGGDPTPTIPTGRHLREVNT